jgi:hypothetical protein
MSPIGKSGKYFMNPNEMKRQGDMPDAAPEAEPLQEENENEQMEGGDGLEHHQIDEMPDGRAHSTHTNPDGSVEEMDHESYDDACAAMSNEAEGEGEEPEGEMAAAPDMGMEDNSGDMAGMYDKAGKRG